MYVLLVLSHPNTFKYNIISESGQYKALYPLSYPRSDTSKYKVSPPTSYIIFKKNYGGIVFTLEFRALISEL